MAAKVTMSWTSGRGNRVSREVKQILDARDFLGTAVYPWLIIAANTDFSASQLEAFLVLNGVGRSESWIKRRRWMCQPPGTNNAKGPMPNEDGNYARAVAVMRQNPKLSVRALAHLLKNEYGIKRSSEWVRKHRCDPLQ